MKHKHLIAAIMVLGFFVGALGLFGIGEAQAMPLVTFGKTPITLRDIKPGLLEYTLLSTNRQLHDGSLWIEPGQEHVEKVEMKPGRVFFVSQRNPKADDNNPGTEEGNRYTHGQLVDTYLTVFEGLMTVGMREGFK